MLGEAAAWEAGWRRTVRALRYYPHFRIITADEASRFASDFAIGLGQAAVSLPLVLTIPHPGDMLREPQLKVSAWGNLQKIKGLLH